jgi:hypothetical protein
MKNAKWISASLLLAACDSAPLAQTKKPGCAALVAQTAIPAAQERADRGAAALDALREKHAQQVFLKLGQTLVMSAADAMPADKYGFAPTDGEFKGVRTFGQQVKHLAAANRDRRDRRQRQECLGQAFADFTFERYRDDSARADGRGHDSCF